MAPVETEYYELLGVPVDVNDTDLKKAYRKQAVKWHPDKNPGDVNAEEHFKEISKAYQILSDPNLRTVYDKYGKKMTEKEGEVGMEDAAGFFAKVFGGDRFYDYIGEISLMKEMTSATLNSMTDEEKAEMEKEMRGTSNPVSPAPETPAAAATSAASVPSTPQPDIASPTPVGLNASHAPPSGSHLSVSPSGTPSQSAPPTPTAEQPPSGQPEGRKGKPKLTPEQRQKLREEEDARIHRMEERIRILTDKLIDRLRPFVDAAKPGDRNDPEITAFEKRFALEADDLKLESFGVELLHTIGNVYMMKATSFMKSRKFLGIPGFFSRLKEKGAFAKEVWGVLGSAVSVQATMQEFAKMQEKGTVPEEELRAMELDVTGRIMLASWRGTRFEVTRVLREVCDNVLKDHNVSETVLLNRAKGMLLIGAIFKSTKPDESDAERRELERMVAEAARGKSNAGEVRAIARDKERKFKAAGKGTPSPAPTPA